MKKAVLSVLVLATLLVSVTSCNKIIDKIFNGFEVRVPDVTIVVPAIPFAPPNELSLGVVSMNYNLDSVVKANTNNVFSGSDVKSIKIKQYVITIPEGDQNNNLSNFQSARVSLVSNSNTTPLDVTSVSIPDVSTNTTTIVPTDSPELISYLRGSKLDYTVFGRARRTTSKPLTFVISGTVIVR